MPRHRVLLGLAAACGLVHAAFSLYWAAGGRWLLDTVGAWATGWAEQAPRTAALALLAVAVAKTVAAVLPLAVAAGRWSWARVPLRVGGLGLAVYGTANTVGAWLVLAGVAGDDSSDRAALLGHAVLWDPLFAAWGVLLALGLPRDGSDLRLGTVAGDLATSGRAPEDEEEHHAEHEPGARDRQEHTYRAHVRLLVGNENHRQDSVGQERDEDQSRRLREPFGMTHG